MKAPFNCTASMVNNFCNYYLDYSNTNYLAGQCECAMDDHTGFCPYPGQPETLTFIKYISLVNDNDHCHTLDRDNMKAQLECGLGDCEEFKQAVQWKMRFERWSSMNGDYVFDCMERFHPDSYSNIKKGY